jgi:RNA polymerase sigma-70 factor (ECF subfamily)
MANGPETGLAEIVALEQRLATDRDATLATYRYLPAAKADLLRRLGRTTEAATAYREALALTEGAVERAFLQSRLSELGAQ